MGGMTAIKDGKAFPLTTQIVSQYDDFALAGVVSAEILPANPRRKFALIQRGPGGGKVRLGFNEAAIPDRGVSLMVDGDQYKITRENLFVGSIRAITDVGNIPLTITEGLDESAVISTFTDFTLSREMQGGPNAGYVACHDQANADSLGTNPLRCGQILFGGNYNVWRLALLFPTGFAIPTSARIQRARLRFTATNNYTGIFQLQNGQPTYPHNPVVVGDYAMGNYADSGASDTYIFTSGLITNVNLNAVGRGWIQKGGSGVTKLCFRSANDISATPPVASEFAGCGDLVSNFPKLEVTWLP